MLHNDDSDVMWFVSSGYSGFTSSSKAGRHLCLLPVLIITMIIMMIFKTTMMIIMMILKTTVMIRYALEKKLRDYSQIADPPPPPPLLGTP